jgi:hypothetical protein
VLVAQPSTSGDVVTVLDSTALAGVVESDVVLLAPALGDHRLVTAVDLAAAARRRHGVLGAVAALLDVVVAAQDCAVPEDLHACDYEEL